MLQTNLQAKLYTDILEYSYTISRRIGAENIMNAGSRVAEYAVLDPHSQEFAERFGRYLIDQGEIDQSAFLRASRAMLETNERFDFVLSRLGLMGEKSLACASAGFLGLPYLTEVGLPDSPVLLDDLDAEYLRRNKIIPTIDDEDKLLVITADPFNQEPADAVSYIMSRPLRLAVASESAVLKTIDQLRLTRADTHPGQELVSLDTQQADEEDVRRLADLASEAPVIRLVHNLIVYAVDANASDIHLEPTVDGLRVRIRLDGRLQDTETFPSNVKSAIISRIKIMAKLDIAERRLPQDGRIRSNVRGRDVDLRVATIPTLGGENIVLRILDRSSIALDFKELGFAGAKLQGLLKILDVPNGMFLVTGPTGSGKTTTLYAALNRLNDPQRKIFTIEDPIEYQLAGINQIQVQPSIDFTFARALRSILRHDPDLIMVGEIRDLETAEMAVQSALTGHLVLSTLHTNGAAASISRLIDMGVEDYLMASTVKGILAQRLVRRLCQHCSVPAPASPELLSCKREIVSDRDWPSYDVGSIRRPVGCEKCRSTGFLGRTTVSELLIMSEPVRSAIVNGRDERSVLAAAKEEGMIGMLEDGLKKVFDGLTTFEEVLRVTQMQ